MNRNVPGIGISPVPAALPPVVTSTERAAAAHRAAQVAASVADDTWTGRIAACDAEGMSAADPLLVARRHVDLLRVRSAICLHAC